MPWLNQNERDEYIEFARRNNLRLPDSRHWVHESHYQEFCLNRNNRKAADDDELASEKFRNDALVNTYMRAAIQRSLEKIRPIANTVDSPQLETIVQTTVMETLSFLITEDPLIHRLFQERDQYRSELEQIHAKTKLPITVVIPKDAVEGMSSSEDPS